MNSSTTTPVDLKVDVAIIGAGSAGLSALAEVKRLGKSFVLIDSGPLGTTCARVGCMPSKVLIELAHEFSKRSRLDSILQITNSKITKIDSTPILSRVREMRDAFVRGPVETVEKNREHFILGQARFLSPNLIQVGKRTIGCEKIVLATGSQPIVPRDWPTSPRIVTSDEFFELRELPAKVAVIGAGPLGLELAMAMAHLGVQVRVYDQKDQIGGIKDSLVQKAALAAICEVLELHLGSEVKLEDLGDAIRIKTGFLSSITHATFEADLVLVAMGRRPRLEKMGLENCGVQLNEKGRVEFNPETMQLGSLPIFIAGDCAQDRPVLHEAVLEGKIAAANACDFPKRYLRRTPLTIAFTHPQLARVGKSLVDLDSKDVAVGEASFEDQGRAKILGEARGLIRVYASKSSEIILGAEMAAPGAEHLAQFLALAIENKLTVSQVLRAPIYHPTLLEGLRTALRQLPHSS